MNGERVADKLHRLIGEGYNLESRAAGRAGSITKLDGDKVYIRSAKDGEIGVTTFERGDPVFVAECPRSKMAYVFNE